jgi:hypothetical protein
MKNRKKILEIGEFVNDMSYPDNKLSIVLNKQKNHNGYFVYKVLNFYTGKIHENTSSFWFKKIDV